MAKFHKQYFYNSKGEKKVFSYNIPIPKVIVEQAKLEDTEVKFTIEQNKIIIEKLLDK